MIEVLPIDNLSELLPTTLLYFNIQTKATYKFFKWMDKPTCARSVEVLHEITKKVNEVEDENGTLVARIKDAENENESCMEMVKQLQKRDDKHMEIINCLEKENDNYRAKDKLFMNALLLSWFTILLIAIWYDVIN
jgi:septal ring factor EnvC (AmiA/AmiB activator)